MAGALVIGVGVVVTWGLLHQPNTPDVVPEATTQVLSQPTPIAATDLPKPIQSKIELPAVNTTPVIPVTAPIIPQLEAPKPRLGIPQDAAAFNGHHFKMIPGEISWNNSAQRCQEMGGHLACCASLGKQAYLQLLKGENMTAWLGGTADVYGKWSWIDKSSLPNALVNGNVQTDGFSYLFMMRNGKFAARPESGRVEGAAIPAVEGFICEWDH